MRQDLSEARIQPTGKTRSTYNSATSACQAVGLTLTTYLIKTEPICQKAALEASKLKRTSSSLCSCLAFTRKQKFQIFVIFELSKNQGCYRLPPLKEISSRDLGRLEGKISLFNWVYTSWVDYHP